MKTTIDLPDDLLRDVKLRALSEGRKLKDMVAELLRKGLDAPEPAPSEDPAAYLSYDEESGLPVILCRHDPKPSEALTPDRVADILLGQEVSRQHDAARKRTSALGGGELGGWG